jgi:hypothetical protein
VRGLRGMYCIDIVGTGSPLFPFRSPRVKSVSKVKDFTFWCTNSLVNW